MLIEDWMSVSWRSCLSTTVMDETSGRKFKDGKLCTPLVVTKISIVAERRKLAACR